MTFRVAWPDLAALALLDAVVLGQHLLPAFAAPLGVVRPVLGLYVALVVPARSLAAKVDPVVGPPVVRVLYAMAAVVLALMLGSLVLNAALPPLGLLRPMDVLAPQVLLHALVLGPSCWRSDRGWAPNRTVRRPLQRPSRRPVLAPLWVPWPRADVAVLVAASAAVTLAVVGAIRLNNGAGGSVTLASLVVGGCTWAALLARRDRLRAGTRYAAIYLLGLGLLLMTSLRGWGITGHDIQREYRVLEAVRAAGHWDIASFRDPYNACLSITLLPTTLSSLTGIGPVYLLKIVPQLLFAACPVIVYLIARRYTSTGISILAALLFVSFPTYFSDMPFLTRQEIAFLFLGVALLVVTDPAPALGRRRILFGVFGAGVVVSHYTTTYVLIVVLTGAVLARRGWRGIGAPMPRSEGPARIPAIGLANVLVLVVLAVTWSQFVTQTNGQLATTLRESITELTAPGSTDARSADTRYNLLGGARTSPEERLAQYRAQTLARTADERSGPSGAYLPLGLVDQAATPVVPDPDLPLTDLGRRLGRSGVDVATANAVLRQGSARLMQVFFALGLIACLVARRRRMRFDLELVCLGGANFVAVLSQVLLPRLSVDYGVLRAFQQALFVLAPFLAYGMVVAAGPLRRRAPIGAAGAGLVFYLSLTGVLPQLTGGYPAQLHLNNAGRYYDVYYLHPGEVQGIAWLDRVAGRTDVQAEIETDRYTLNRVQARLGTRLGTGLSTRPIDDIYPTLLRRDAYVFLGYATVHKGQATVVYAGDLITYDYPMPVLASAKDLIYTNGSAQIFR